MRETMAATTDDITDFDTLFDRSILSLKGVGWKPSVQHFQLNDIDILLQMEDKLRTKKWRHAVPRPVHIPYPKPRDGLSIPFRDRVYQRSINDLALYPEVTRSFILDNAACQQGKGPDFARARLRKHIWNHYCHYGLTGYVVQVDVKGYYANMPHKLVEEIFRKHLTPAVFEMVVSILRTQDLARSKEERHSGRGYCPGSQMVQIAGISALDSLDHYIKERLHCRYYIRYMDDLWILLPTLERAEEVLAAVSDQLRLRGFEAHPKKTHIRPLSRSFDFLGFRYTVTRTGKIYAHIKPEAVKHERRKMRRMAALVLRGERTVEKLYECLHSWCDHASRGNSKTLLAKLYLFVNNLLCGESDENHQDSANTCRAGGAGRAVRRGRADPRGYDLYRRYGWHRAARGRRAGATY